MKKVLLIVLLLFLPVSIASARIGVGVGTGKIVVDEKLKPGIIYNLPPLTVVNTGDESSDYQVAVTYHEGQAQLKPAEDWFIFTPKEFKLDPGEVQVVDIKLNLPVSMEPGDYFAYLEGHPLKKSQSGTTSISIAAAAKLYFTVVPANFFQAVYYKIVSFWTIYSPWTDRAAILLGVIVVSIFIKKFFHIEVNLKKKEKNKRDTKEKEITDSQNE